MKVKVKQNPQRTVATVAGIQGPPGPNMISTAYDVDTSDLRDGSVLVYEEQTEKWKSTLLLNKQAIDAGEF